MNSPIDDIEIKLEYHIGRNDKYDALHIFLKKAKV